MADSSPPHFPPDQREGEEPSLPRTWRPRFARAILIGIAVALAVVSLGMWVLMPADVRAQFSAPQALTLLGFLVAVDVGLYVLSRTRAYADESGLTVVNAFRAHRLEWAQIVGVHLRPGDPWARLDLAEGDTLSVMGIQAADGEHGRDAARELATLVVSRTRTERDD